MEALLMEAKDQAEWSLIFFFFLFLFLRFFFRFFIFCHGLLRHVIYCHLSFDNRIFRQQPAGQFFAQADDGQHGRPC